MNMKKKNTTVKLTEKLKLLAYDHLNANAIKMPIYFTSLVYVLILIVLMFSSKINLISCLHCFHNN